MIISHSRQFIFVHVHKTGGTSIERALDPHLAWNDLILGGTPFGEKVQKAYAPRYKLNKHSTVAEIENVCGARYLDEYFVFALVRHPLARACSIYNYIATSAHKWAERNNVAVEDVRHHLTDEARRKNPEFAWPSMKVFLKNKGFSSFIRNKKIAEAPAFQSQASVLSRKDSTKIAAEIFRLEDRPQWEKRLGERLGINIELPRSNVSEVRPVRPEAVAAEDKALIESMFRIDYETFGYEP
jgi:hypothetical protein